jgi:hypothetical protein
MSATRLRPFALIAATAILMSCDEDSSFEPPAQTTAPQLVGALAEDVVPGQYIVVFRDDVRSPAAAAKEMAATHGFKLRHTYSHAIRGFSATVPEGRLSALQRHPLVEYVQPNRYLYIDTHERFNRARSSPLGTSAAVAAPSGLNAVAISSSEITLTWNDNSDDESGFEIQGAKGLDGPFSKIASVKANVTQHTDKELSAGVLYCYRVRATVGKGRNKQYSSYTPTDCATTLSGPPGDPPADNRPTDLTATGQPGAVDLEWIDNWDAETHYAIERCGPVQTDLDPEPGCADFRGLVRVGKNVTAYSDEAVTAALEYCYRVKGMREKGKKVTYSEYSNAACGVPMADSKPVGAPTGLVATSISHVAVELAWTDESTGEEGFEIERIVVPSGPSTTISVPGPNREFFIDTGLSETTTYTYKVRAVNSLGESSYSLPADVTTSAELGTCADPGTHDDVSTQLWNIRRVRAHRNPKWQAARLGGSCALNAWLFVLDTGVDLDASELNVAAGSRCFLNSCEGTDPQEANDDNGHGTHVAGAAAAFDGNGGVVGVAPGTQIYAFKVCDEDGACPADAVLAGVEAVTAAKTDPANLGKAMVVNLSLGGPGTDPALEAAVRASVQAGVVYAISAGNGDLGACYFPADAQNFTPANVGDDPIPGSLAPDHRTNGAIVTTASDQGDHDYNCNYGAPVTVAAPGVDILSTLPGPGNYTSFTGASMATPHTAGAIVLYLHDNLATSPAAVEAFIMSRLDDWTTTEEHDADGRLNVEGL